MKGIGPAQKGSILPQSPPTNPVLLPRWLEFQHSNLVKDIKYFNGSDYRLDYIFKEDLNYTLNLTKEWKKECRGP